MFKQLSQEEARDAIANKNIIIADVRDEDSFNESHIDSARHLTMAMVQDFCDREDKSQPILVYCYHGISSQSVAQHLVDQGFSEVFSLAGGFEAWKTYQTSAKDD